MWTNERSDGICLEKFRFPRSVFKINFATATRDCRVNGFSCYDVRFNRRQSTGTCATGGAFRQLESAKMRLTISSRHRSHNNRLSVELSSFYSVTQLFIGLDPSTVNLMSSTRCNDFSSITCAGWCQWPHDFHTLSLNFISKNFFVDLF